MGAFWNHTQSSLDPSGIAGHLFASLAYEFQMNVSPQLKMSQANPKHPCAATFPRHTRTNALAPIGGNQAGICVGPPVKWRAFAY